MTMLEYYDMSHLNLVYFVYAVHIAHLKTVTDNNVLMNQNCCSEFLRPNE